MSRLNSVDPAAAEGKVKEILASVEEDLGSVPNIFKGMANSPAALGAYLAIDEAMEGAALTPAEWRVVYLTVSQCNNCTYCLSANTVLGAQAGLSEEQMKAVRRGEVDDEKLNALARFTRAILDKKGFVSDEELEAFRAVGYTDAHAAEVCAVIGQATFSNYFNHVNDTPLDFPRAPEL
jgi:uncharacterized peroxidase-related enzyme